VSERTARKVDSVLKWAQDAGKDTGMKDKTAQSPHFVRYVAENVDSCLPYSSYLKLFDLIEQHIVDTNAKKTVLSCHRYLINTDVEKMNNI